MDLIRTQTLVHSFGNRRALSDRVSRAVAVYEPHEPDSQPSPRGKTRGWASVKRSMLSSSEETKPMLPSRLSQAVSFMMANTGLRRKQLGKHDLEEEETNVPIPAWSVEDRAPRVLIENDKSFTTKILNSTVVTLVYALYLVYECSLEPDGREWPTAIILCLFIMVHMVVAFLAAVPNPTLSTAELNHRVNGTILFTMVLYPGLGLWVMDRNEPWNLPHHDAFYKVYNESGDFQWGSVFPVVMWGMSAIMILHHGYSGYTVDIEGVATAPDGTQTTVLYRRVPDLKERTYEAVMYMLTSSLWHWLPLELKPAGGAGRFLFQLISPVVILFQYIGWRFVCFSVQQIKYVWEHRNGDYTNVQAWLYESGEYDDDMKEAMLAVWVCFLVLCILIRAFLSNPKFLDIAISDQHARDHRRLDWARIVTEGKRTRVLWGFRGFINALAPVVIAHRGKGSSTYRTDNHNVDGFGDRLLWYMYLCVYLSYLFEGCVAFWFGLHQAEIGCHIRTPIPFFATWFNWLAYNTFLQPLGSLVNIFFYWFNGEYQKKVVFREFFGPLLDNQGNFRFKYFAPAVTPATPAEIEDQLSEFLTKFRLQKEFLGMSTDTYDVVRSSGDVTLTSSAELPQVFRGSMFPEKVEWRHMSDNYPSFIPLRPEEATIGPEKFLSWYPTHADEIKNLLQKPHDFENEREVWMFGYGSLISPDSPPGGLTDEQRKKLIPYWLTRKAGYRRAWNYRHGSAGITALGLEKVSQDQADDVCGCVYPIDYSKATSLFCGREDGYDLLLVHQDFFSAMHPEYQMPPGVGYVWICGAPTSVCNDPNNDPCTDRTCKRHYPTTSFPILQTYVDSILVGALRYKTAGVGNADGMNFAAALINSIHGWDRPWFNDRLIPGRPWTYRPEWSLIDGLLSACPNTASAFANRLQPSLAPAEVWRSIQAHEYQVNLPWSRRFFGDDDTNSHDQV